MKLVLPPTAAEEETGIKFTVQDIAGGGVGVLVGVNLGVGVLVGVNMGVGVLVGLNLGVGVLVRVGPAATVREEESLQAPASPPTVTLVLMVADPAPLPVAVVVYGAVLSGLVTVATETFELVNATLPTDPPVTFVTVAVKIVFPPILVEEETGIKFTVQDIASGGVGVLVGVNLGVGVLVGVNMGVGVLVGLNLGVGVLVRVGPAATVREEESLQAPASPPTVTLVLMVADPAPLPVAVVVYGAVLSGLVTVATETFELVNATLPTDPPVTFVTVAVKIVFPPILVEEETGIKFTVQDIASGGVGVLVGGGLVGVLVAGGGLVGVLVGGGLVGVLVGGGLVAVAIGRGVGVLLGDPAAQQLTVPLRGPLSHTHLPMPPTTLYITRTEVHPCDPGAEAVQPALVQFTVFVCVPAL